jgi:putative long chain acyl-CoA synthase
VDALGDVDAIDLAVVYGVPESGGEICLAIAAVTVRDGFELTPGAVAGALDAIDANERPDIVHVVEEIPVTTWYRPVATKLQAAGMPQPGAGTWRRDGDDYVPLEAESKPAAVA